MKPFEFDPLVWVEESISIGKVEIFTEKAGDLALSTKGVVTQHNATAPLFRLHNSLEK